MSVIVEIPNQKNCLLAVQNPGEVEDRNVVTEKTLIPAVTIRRVDELHPHPTLVRLQIDVPADALGRDYCVVVTHVGTILEGFSIVEAARQKGLQTWSCVELDLSEEEALEWLIQRHCRPKGLNDFCRILLAMALKSSLRKKAQRNQQEGGRNKASSSLTEADKVDVRSKIAATAAVGEGNVTKVEQILANAHPLLLQALRNGEISIDAAWKLASEPQASQQKELDKRQLKKAIKKDMFRLASRRKSNNVRTVRDADWLLQQLSALESSKPGSIDCFESNVAGKAVCVTKDLLQELRLQMELVN